MTPTLKLHDVPVGSVAPDRLTLFDPAVATIAPPPQLPARPLGVATARPAGSVSVKAMPVSAIALAAGLTMLKVNVVEPPGGMEAGANDLAMGGGATTVTRADAVLPVPAAGVVLPGPAARPGVPDREVLDGHGDSCVQTGGEPHHQEPPVRACAVEIVAAPEKAGAG